VLNDRSEKIFAANSDHFLREADERDAPPPAEARERFWGRLPRDCSTFAQCEKRLERIVHDVPPVVFCDHWRQHALSANSGPYENLHLKLN